MIYIYIIIYIYLYLYCYVYNIICSNEAIHQKKVMDDNYNTTG